MPPPIPSQFLFRRGRTPGLHTTRSFDASSRDALVRRPAPCMLCLHCIYSAIRSPIRAVPDIPRLHLVTLTFPCTPDSQLRVIRAPLDRSLLQSNDHSETAPLHAFHVSMQAFRQRLARPLRSCTHPFLGVLVHIRLGPPRVRKHAWFVSTPSVDTT